MLVFRVWLLFSFVLRVPCYKIYILQFYQRKIRVLFSSLLLPADEHGVGINIAFFACLQANICNRTILTKSEHIFHLSIWISNNYCFKFFSMAYLCTIYQNLFSCEIPSDQLFFQPFLQYRDKAFAPASSYFCWKSCLVRRCLPTCCDIFGFSDSRKE